MLGGIIGIAIGYFFKPQIDGLVHRAIRTIGIATTRFN